MKYLISSVLIGSFLFVTKSYSSECKSEYWKSKRASNSSVSVEGQINKPNTWLSIDVYKHTKLIGSTRAYSNDRGMFLKTVHTNTKPYKRPPVVISCT